MQLAVPVPLSFLKIFCRFRELLENCRSDAGILHEFTNLSVVTSHSSTVSFSLLLTGFGPMSGGMSGAPGLLGGSPTQAPILGLGQMGNRDPTVGLNLMGNMMGVSLCTGL